MISIATLLSVFVAPFSLAFVGSLTLTPLTAYLYRIYGWVDDPSVRKEAKTTHTYPVPRGGGIPIFFSLFLGSVIYLGLDKHVLGILLGAFLLAVVGVVDDRINLSPYLRLVLGVAAALAVVASGIGIAFITNPFGGVINLSQPQVAFDFLGQTRTIWVIADLVAVLWIVWCMNMVNWAKGLDGQLPGVVVIAAITIALLSFRFTQDVTQWGVSVLAAVTAGAYLGFLPWNFFPQSIMPGYGGGALAGYLLAVLSILSGAKLATLILVLGVPMTDAFYTIVRRLASGRSPVWGDRGHLHHKLLDLGWSKRRVAVFYWMMTAALGYISLRLNSQQKLFTIVLLIFFVGGVLLWLNYFISFSKRPGRDSGLRT